MSSDPISFIFGILKYVKKRFHNDNINNNNNNININININNHYDPIIKAVGSCVRAMLHNEEYIDISLVISCPRIVTEFVAILELTEIMSYHEDKLSKYKILRIFYKNKQHTIFIANEIKNLPNYNQSLSLTCNNLAINFDGNISTIVPHNEIKRHNSLTWTTSCIQDAISGKFRVIVLDNMNTLDKIIMYNDICQNMVNLGFIFDIENSKNLTSYQFLEIKSHCVVSQFCKNREVSQCCCICREQYSSEPNKKTILIGCLHDFHIDCLHKWVKNQSQSMVKKTCPVCRADLKYEPGMVYGDNQVDEIIQNIIEPAQYD
jgi:hypothetical protein